MIRMRLLLCCLWTLLAAIVPADELNDQAAEFRRLREVKGHFQGGDRWLNEVDSWGGRKHMVMGQLQDALGVPGTNEARIVELMGIPDEKARAGSLSWRLARVQGPPSPRGNEGDVDVLLIYHWRGAHDFLYFSMKAGQVVKAGWWMALE